MANQILLSVDKKRLSVAPGASVDLAVTAQNLTTLLDQVAVRAEGIDVSWFQVIPPYLPVFAQGQATARVVFQPPRDPSVAVAGIYALRVCGASQEYPGQEGEAATELEVQLVGDYRFWLDRGAARDRQEAVFAVKVQNSANAPLRLQFKGSDPGDALWYKFDPFQLDVSPGGHASALLALRAKNAAPEERALAFTLTAQGEFTSKGGAAVTAPVHQVSGQFTQGAPARLTISVEPPQVQAADRGVFQIRVGNPGAAPATVQLSATDDGGLEFDFEHVETALPPQSETNIRLVVRSKASLTPAAQQRREFRVTAQPVDGETQAVSTQVAFVQIGSQPVAPASRAWVWVIVVVALLCAALMAAALIAGFGLRILR